VTIWFDIALRYTSHGQRSPRFVIKFLMPARSKTRPADSLSKAQYEKLAALRYRLRQFLHFSELAARIAGLTPRQYQALLAIKGYPNRERITIGELAEQLHIAHHSAVGLVDRSNRISSFASRASRTDAKFISN
jgi:DNA-binding CsgD family transcriptional regulator